MKKSFFQLKNNRSFLLGMICNFMALGLFSCSGDKELDATDDAVPFEPLPVSSTITAKDFNQSDIDLLVEAALKIEGIRLEYTKIMSNNLNDPLFSGPGSESDGRKCFDYVTDLLQNKTKYSEAIERLTASGVLSKSTVTRGIFSDFAEFCIALASPGKQAHDKNLETLNALKVTGNQKIMDDLFKALPEKYRNGETSSKQWFINYYAGEYSDQDLVIRENWLEDGNLGNSMGSSLFAEKDAELNDKGAGNYRWKEHHETIKTVAEKGGSFYVSCIDEVTGGVVGKWIDANDIAEGTIKLAKKIREGKATTADLKQFVTTIGSKYVKEKTGELFEDWDIEDPVVKEIANRLAGEVTDYVTNHAAESNEAEIAEGLGMNLYEVQKGTLQGVAVTIIEDIKEGNYTIGFPDKDGTTRIVTKPGEKNITTITSDEQRITRNVPEEKPGKVEIKADSVPNNVKPYVTLSQSYATFFAKGGATSFDIFTECRYVRANITTKDDKEWVKVKREGKTVHIVVEPNFTGKERKATITVDVSMDGKKVDASTTYTVTQETDSETGVITATPSALSFDADGGTQTINVTTGGYPYYGGFAEDCEDWISVSTGDDATLIVKAEPNTSTKERTGTIVVFGSDVKNPATMKDVKSIEVKVTQAAGESGVANLKLSGANVYLSLREATSTSDPDFQVGPSVEVPYCTTIFGNNFVKGSVQNVGGKAIFTSKGSNSTTDYYGKHDETWDVSITLKLTGKDPTKISDYVVETCSVSYSLTEYDDEGDLSRTKESSFTVKNIPPFTYGGTTRFYEEATPINNYLSNFKYKMGMFDFFGEDSKWVNHNFTYKNDVNWSVTLQFE